MHHFLCIFVVLLSILSIGKQTKIASTCDIFSFTHCDDLINILPTNLAITSNNDSMIVRMKSVSKSSAIGRGDSALFVCDFTQLICIKSARENFLATFRSHLYRTLFFNIKTNIFILSIKDSPTVIQEQLLTKIIMEEWKIASSSFKCNMTTVQSPYIKYLSLSQNSSTPLKSRLVLAFEEMLTAMDPSLYAPSSLPIPPPVTPRTKGWLKRLSLRTPLTYPVNGVASAPSLGPIPIRVSKSEGSTCTWPLAAPRDDSHRGGHDLDCIRAVEKSLTAILARFTPNLHFDSNRGDESGLFPLASGVGEGGGEESSPVEGVTDFLLRIQQSCDSLVQEVASQVHLAVEGGLAGPRIVPRGHLSETAVALVRVKIEDALLHQAIPLLLDKWSKQMLEHFTQCMSQFPADEEVDDLPTELRKLQDIYMFSFETAERKLEKGFNDIVASPIMESKDTQSDAVRQFTATYRRVSHSPLNSLLPLLAADYISRSKSKNWLELSKRMREASVEYLSGRAVEGSYNPFHRVAWWPATHLNLNYLSNPRTWSQQWSFRQLYDTHVEGPAADRAEPLMLRDVMSKVTFDPSQAPIPRDAVKSTWDVVAESSFILGLFKKSFGATK